MASDSADELTRSIKELGNQHIQAMYELTEIHAKDLRTMSSMIFEDLIDSYDALIQQREQIIDRQVKLISYFFKDEIDVSKPIQSLVEKKMNDVAELKQEIAPIKEFKYLMDNDIEDEVEYQKVFDRIKNM